MLVVVKALGVSPLSGGQEASIAFERDLCYGKPVIVQDFVYERQVFLAELRQRHGLLLEHCRNELSRLVVPWQPYGNRRVLPAIWEELPYGQQKASEISNLHANIYRAKTKAAVNPRPMLCVCIKNFTS